MRVYDDICDMLNDELEQIVQKHELTSNALDIMYKITDVVKDIKTIEAMEDSKYSYDNMGRMPYMYDDGYSRSSNGGSYDGSHDSYSTRGRGRYADRDSRGRYSGNYSNDVDETIRKLHQMMQNANDQDRPVIQRIINQMQN